MIFLSEVSLAITSEILLWFIFTLINTPPNNHPSRPFQSHTQSLNNYQQPVQTKIVQKNNTNCIHLKKVTKTKTPKININCIFDENEFLDEIGQLGAAKYDKWTMKKIDLWKKQFSFFQQNGWEKQIGNDFTLYF